MEIMSSQYHCIVSIVYSLLCKKYGKNFNIERKDETYRLLYNGGTNPTKFARQIRHAIRFYIDQCEDASLGGKNKNY